MWFNGARNSKKEELDQKITYALADVAEDLMSPLNNGLPNTGKGPIFDDLLNLGNVRPSIIQQYSAEEIFLKIRKAFNKNGLKNYKFEFALQGNGITGGQIVSENFMALYADTIDNDNLAHALPLEAPSGSAFENLGNEEIISVIVPNKNLGILKELFWFIFFALLFTTVISTAFYITVRSLLRQKKVAEIKNDFINNMTHEFKTPLATISLAVDSLKNEKVLASPEKWGYFVGIIKEENKRMNKQVESILQAALLEKQNLELKLKKCNAQDLIEAAINNIRIQVEEKGGSLNVQQQATKVNIMADEVHFTNLVNNLLDNALKYSKEKPQVTLSTQNKGKNLIIKVEDNGIGMTKETLGQIFEKFYRAHTGNVHNVKGFGLGLSYVQTMVQAHNGTIKAESTVGKGSIFTVTIPTTI
jgi:two-component system, OmpR family, phosphate regulon sensor histidine kinase PhoR